MGSDAALDQREQTQQDWLQLVDDLIGQTEQAPDDAARVALLCKAAEIYERRLGDADNAIVALQAAFRADPRSGQVVREMERLARANGKWAEVVASTAEVVESLEPAEDAPAEEEAASRKLRADLWVQIAFWCDGGLGRLEDAAASARHALDIDAAHGGALALLEDIYRRQRSWDSFVEIMARRWALVSALPATDRADVAKIAAAYVEALKIEPEHAGLLSGLARVYEDTADWERAATIWGRLAGVVGSEQRVAIHHRLGTILEQQLDDARAAEEQFAQALALHPTQAHVPSMQALIAIYQRRGDWLKAAQLLLRVADASADAGAAEQARLTFDAAEIHHHRLDDPARAAELYQATAALAPEHPGTLEPLSAIYFARADWPALAALAPTIEAASVEMPAPRRAALFHRLARAAQAAGDVDAALTFYGRSAAADGAYRPMLEDWGALAYERESWADAARLGDAFLLQSGPAELSRAQLEVATFRLGWSRLRLGELESAVSYLDRALALGPGSRATLLALVEAHTRAGDAEAVIRDKQALLALGGEREAKRALHEEIGDIHWAGLDAAAPRHDAHRAIASYFAALELEPNARPLLHKVLELLTATKQWEQSVAILLRLADLEEGAVRGRFFVAAANVLNYELGSYDDALTLYERALDSDPGDLQTFERIDKLLTAAQSWRVLERAYRKQITRMGLGGSDPPAEQRPAMLALWGGLGEIYRSRLQDYDGAIPAFEVCVAMDPEDLSRRTALAELYQLVAQRNGDGAGYEKAVVERRQLLRRARDAGEMAPHLKVLLRLLVELGRLDHAWCVAQLLTLLGRADADERRLFEQYRPNGIARARSRLTEELWQRSLYHPDEDRVISSIFAAVGPAVAMARAKEHKEWGLKRKERRDLATDPTLVSKVLAYAAQVIGVAVPEVYLLPDSPGEIDLANARAGAVPAPALVAGKDVLAGRSETETAFLATRALAMLRPDHVLRWPSVVPTIAELQIVLLAAITLGRPDVAILAEAQAAVAQYAEFMRKLFVPQTFEQLELLVNRLLAARGADAAVAELPRWARAAYLTAARAGLLVCGDLEVAVRLGQAGAVAGGALDASEVARELCDFSISDDYFLLRRQLGMGLG